LVLHKYSFPVLNSASYLRTTKACSTVHKLFFSNDQSLFSIEPPSYSSLPNILAISNSSGSSSFSYLTFSTALAFIDDILSIFGMVNFLSEPASINYVADLSSRILKNYSISFLSLEIPESFINFKTSSWVGELFPLRNNSEYAA
jgi:hypothetical protein